jgi:hypothetical protein
VIILLLIWFLLLAVFIRFGLGRGPSTGALTLAYFLGLSLIHVPGLLAYLDPASMIPFQEETRIGFELTLEAIAVFVFGVLVARRRFGRVVGSRATQRREADMFESLGWRAIVIGIVAYFVIQPLSFSIASMTAVVSQLGTLKIIGFWLRLHGAVLAHSRQRIVSALALLPALPLSTLTLGGFLGYGIYWVLSVLSFLFVIVRRRSYFYLAAPIVVLFGLSMFITYMGQRPDIREVVWQEDTGLLERIDRVSTLVTKFETLDLSNPIQRAHLSLRLNQNYLIGIGVKRYRSGEVDLAYGATVPAWSLIPRAVWPNKPVIGGGLDVVADFTGLEFNKKTSVGAGQVLEFFYNFGMPGVLVGFFVLGFTFMWLDYKIIDALAARDLRRFLYFAMPGLVMLQPGGNLLEILVALVAAVAMSRLLVMMPILKLQQVAAEQRVARLPPRNARMPRRR